MIQKKDKGEKEIEIKDKIVRYGEIEVIVVEQVEEMKKSDEIEGEMGD